MKRAKNNHNDNANNAMKRATMMLLVLFSFALFANAEKRPQTFYWVQHEDQSSTSTDIFLDYIDDEVSTITLKYNVLTSDIW